MSDNAIPSNIAAFADLMYKKERRCLQHPAPRTQRLLGGRAMTKRDLPSPELLRKLLRYDPDTGKLFWVERTPDMFLDGAKSASHNCAAWNGRSAGREAFATVREDGYLHGRILGRLMLAHRVIFAMHHGVWPENEVDHINGDRTENRIHNLRGATKIENMRNMKRSSANKSGKTGVHWCKREEKWVAQIRDASGQRCLGYFKEKSSAIEVRVEAERRIGYHSNHGRYSSVQ